MIDKPYDDDGHEHSARIAQPGEKDYYEVYAQRTAARVVKGKIGDPNGATWAVELAFAHSDTIAKNPLARKPQLGDKWRINFSRVEHKGDINWTWQAQRIWDPVEKRVVGKVAMHLPDAWGYVQFGAPESKLSGEMSILDAKNSKGRDTTWPARLTVMNIYYAQRRYAELNVGCYAPNVTALVGFCDAAILRPFLDSSILITLSDDHKHYTASVIDTSHNVKAKVTEERLLIVDRIGDEVVSK